jgi:ribonuclease HI
MPSTEKRLIAACDGATKGNPGPSAWAWVLADADGTVLRWRSGPLGHATNNIAELTALRELLVEVGAGARVEARLDSQYTINAVTKWLPAWKKNGWMTSGKKPVANADLIREIDALLGSRDVVFVHVAAHQVNGDPYNDLADRAASATAISQQALEGTDASQVPGTPDRPAGSSRAGGGGGGGGSAKPKKAFTIQAKFAGTCSCGRGYDAGEKITKLDNGRWGHVACA